MRAREFLIFALVLATVGLVTPNLVRSQTFDPPESTLRLPNGLDYTHLHLGGAYPGMTLRQVEAADPHQMEVTYHPEEKWVRDIEGFRLFHDSTLLVSKGDTPETVRKALGPPSDERMHWNKLLGQGFDWFYLEENLVLTFYGGKDSAAQGVWLYKCELIWDRAKEAAPDCHSWRGRGYP
jgi:hypothetical protein